MSYGNNFMIFNKEKKKKTVTITVRDTYINCCNKQNISKY